MNNKKISFILITLLGNMGFIQARCGGGGDSFLPAFGGSFLGSSISNFMFRPRQQEVVVVQQPQPQYGPPAPVMIEEEEIPQHRIRERRSSQASRDLERRRIELELLKEENRAEELRLEKRRLEIQRSRASKD